MRTTETDREISSVPLQVPVLVLLFSAEAGIVQGRTLALPEGSCLVGRDAALSDSGGLALPEDFRASRQHARFVATSTGLCVTDLDSKNGTFVNGARIPAGVDHPLKVGDVIRIGNALLLLRTESEPLRDPPEVPFVAIAPEMCALARRLLQLAPSQAVVLLLGESGVGKEVFAQALHDYSGRTGPFRALNCAEIPIALAESRLFGHLKGAFTGASSAEPGFLRAAHDGTLLLDEVGELATELQPKLLRALAERQLIPVGATVAQPFTARIIAATNRDLDDAIESGTFRSDLHSRLRAEVLKIPPLRCRREEILPILARYLKPVDGTPRSITARLAEALVLYSWPYNVREVVQLATHLIEAHPKQALFDLPDAAEKLRFASASPAKVPKAKVPEAKEKPPGDARTEGGAPAIDRMALARLLTEHQGVIERVAVTVGRSRRQVNRWMAHYGLSKKDYMK